MKRYPIKFVTDYAQYEEYSSDSNEDEDSRNHFKKELLNHQDEWQACINWSGKEMTLQELEENIDKFGEVLFDGKRIMVVNDYLD